jgi:TonB-linked SusC/RagA family outer membrane protein
MENRCNFLVIPLKSIRLSNLRRKLRGTGLLLFFIITQILGISTNATAQQVAVKGTVKDQKGETLIGVTVQVKGTTTGVVTDTGGSYTIANVPSNASLVFSFVGLTTQEVQLNGRSRVDVVLVEQAVGIDEVVVVGYGTAKKINLTGSFASVTSKELKAIPTSNIVTGLAGLLPGLRVTQKTGEPGAYNTTYDIRGFGTPLIVIDGLVSNASTFVRLNPNEIDQLTIVKDASAAIYGIQAANGVILITTKKGDIGKPKITYTGSFEVQQLGEVLPVGDALTFATLVTENDINQGKAPTYTADDLQKYRDGTYPSTDWRAAVANDRTFQMQHNITVTGGNEKIKYFTSMGYLDEMGLWKSGDLNYKKYNIRTSVTGKISDNLEAQINLAGVMDPRNEPMMGVGNALFSIGLQNPATPIYANDNPQYLFAAVSGEHPIGLTNANIGGYTKTKNQNIQGSFQLNYNIPFVKGLSARLLFGFDKQDNFQRQWKQKFLMYTYDKVKDLYTNSLTFNAPSNLIESYSTQTRTTVLGQLNYEKSFLEKHNVKAALIFEERHDINDNFNAKKEFTINIDQFAAGIAANQTVGASYPSENDNQNVIGRLNYDFVSKYLFEFGFNYSGSSKFPEGKRWGFFPYSSLGWRISEENFFKSALPLITNLKLRGSYGVMGDDAASSFQYVSGYNYPSGNYVFGTSLVPGLGFRALPNMNITWFTVTSKNLALDISVKNGLFYGQLDLFQRNRSGLLATRLLTIPGTVGAAMSQENLNEDMRKGFEAILGHSKTMGNLRYDISANVTYTRGMPTKIERAADANSYLNWRNNTTNRWDNITWGYKYIGQFQSVEEALSSPIQDGKGNATYRPGDLKYEDVNKDGIIDNLDVVPIGRSVTRDMNFGLTGRVSYKQFDFTILLQGAAYANYSYNGALQSPLLLGRNTLKVFLDRWHRTDLYNVNSAWVQGKFPSTFTPTTTNTNTSIFWSPDASYLRLKQLEIGYTLKKTILSKIGVDNLRVFASGFNLLTWTKITYVDPELDSGNWNSNYPITNIYNFGISLTF